ncbi:MAG TPA: DUF3084 domain-containing protein [Fimbriimonas sp.]
MSLTSVGFLVLIVLVSGGIAVLADWLGRKVGKKKLTIQTRWFRLRPKATAKVSTFLSGVAVSAFTILFVSAVSSDVRQWIAEGPAALAKLRMTLRELDQAKTTKDQLDDQIFVSSERLRRSEATIGRQQAHVAKLNRQTSALQTQLRRYESSLGAAQRRYDDAQRSYRAIQAKLAPLQAQLKTAQADLAAARNNLRSAQANLKEAESNLDKTQKNYVMSQRQFEEAATQVKEMTTQALEAEHRVDELGQQVRSLESQRLLAETDLENAQRRLSKVQEDLVQTSIAYEQLQAELNQTRVNFQKAGGAVAVSRFQPLMFGLGEEIARLSLPPMATEEEALKAIRNLVALAQRTAEEKGAEARGPFPSAGIFERTDPTTHRVFKPEELEEQLAKSVAYQEDGQLLIAVSTLNAFRGEPVSLEVAVAENPLVYKASDVVAEARVDGKKEESVILGQITDFVSNQVKEQARLDRMIAKRGVEAGFGSVPVSELYELVNRVKTARRMVRLQAVAAADTRAGDALKLDFRVK